MIIFFMAEGNFWFETMIHVMELSVVLGIAATVGFMIRAKRRKDSEP